MNMKLPTSFMGYDGKTELERIENEKVAPKQPKLKTNFSPINIEEFEKYDYFFAGENEYNLYKEFVEKYFPRKVKSGLKTLEELAKPELKDKLFKGSSPIINSAMNMALRDGEVYVVTQAQLEYVKEKNKLNLSGIYSDTGMCLRSNSGNNEKHAKDLTDQLNPRKAFPIYLPVISYDLNKDNSNNLNFKIVDRSKILKVPILNGSNGNFNDSDIDINTGFPKKLDAQGKRSFWKTDSGLSGCYLNRGSNLDSSNSSLSYSNDDGRVVLAKPQKIFGGSN